ncbi:YdeI/OmpD-associated family protein, partial [Lishizhenia sp.]|uniref:YdeI/OmpD-associated family protein n=1 Tax=Lishizhenia sp. TaxID=2497594 RepID=UPI00299F017A
VIERAKKNGSWTLLDSVEALIVPEKLNLEFNKYEGARDYYESLSKSSKKLLLSWIVLAKREATKMKRIQAIAEAASQQQKPKQLQ